MADEVTLAQDFLDVILKTQYLTGQEMREYQGRLLGALYRHAREAVPHYADRPELGEVINPVSPEWLSQPYVSRANLAAEPHALLATHLPAGHGGVQAVESGGSTGKAVGINLSSLELVARIVATYRMFGTWGMDPAQPLFMIRKAQASSNRKDTVGFRKWSYPWLPETELGDRIHIDIFTPVEEQLRRLSERVPAYVNSLPSNIQRMGIAASASDHPLSLPFIVSVAEYLAPEVRALAESTFGARVINVFSSSEAGVIAIECSVSGMLHIQSELVLAEIVKENGEPAKEGETGELVVTAFYNHANPLIRYKSGDYVVKGPPCPCGRMLPTIAKVAGRREHMFTFPDGRRELPAIDRVRITELLSHKSWQFVQVSEREAVLEVAGASLEENRQREFRDMLETATEGAFQITCRTVADLPPTSGGKRHFCMNRIHSRPVAH